MFKPVERDPISFVSVSVSQFESEVSSECVGQEPVATAAIIAFVLLAASLRLQSRVRSATARRRPGRAAQSESDNSYVNKLNQYNNVPRGMRHDADADDAA